MSLAKDVGGILMAHLGAKILTVAALGGAALLVKNWWHGAGTGPGKVPTTPHGSTVTPTGNLVAPTPPYKGGAAPSAEANSTSIDPVDYTAPATAYTSVESWTASTPALAQADILTASETAFSNTFEPSAANNILSGASDGSGLQEDTTNFSADNTPADNTPADNTSSFWG